MKSKILLFYYFILLTVEISAELLAYYSDNYNLVYFTKPLLMPTLIAWAFLFAKENNITFNKIIILAVIFSLFGDIALMLLSISPDIFIIGLVCFLVAHIIYIVLFIKIASKQKSLLISKPYFIIPFIIYAGLLLGFLYQQNHPEFIKMQIPVIIYAAVILTMLLAAVSSYGNILRNNFMLLTVGAFLFVLSDTTIALSKFSPLFEHHQHIARIIIMSLYGTAQFLIIKGYVSINKNSTIQTN